MGMVYSVVLSPGRRCVKLRRILSPQAELSSECMTSWTFIELFERERATEDISGASPVSKEVRSPYISRGVREGLMLDHSLVGVLDPDARPPRLVSRRGRSWRPLGLDSARRCCITGESMGGRLLSNPGWLCGVIVPAAGPS